VKGVLSSAEYCPSQAIHPGFNSAASDTFGVHPKPSNMNHPKAFTGVTFGRG